MTKDRSIEAADFDEWHPERGFEFGRKPTVHPQPKIVVDPGQVFPAVQHQAGPPSAGKTRRNPSICFDPGFRRERGIVSGV